jgi:glycosyltransferase involved in cell wall biosynthesis
MKIHGFHDGHACGYYRITLPMDALTANGHDVTTSWGWDDTANGARIIVGQRIGKTGVSGLWRRLRAQHKLVYETDDDVWTIDPTNLSAVFAHDAVTLDMIEESIRAAHLVTVSTEPLAEVLRKFHDNVVVLPNHIDGRLLEMERARRERVTVGWAGGDSHLRDIDMIAPTLRRFIGRNPKVDFHNIGTDYTRVLKIPGRVTGWEANVWDYYQHIDFDIGLAPLVDSTFNRSKSAIKAMEYAALGIPVIASDREPYRPFVLDGVTGFLVRREHEWAKRLRELVNDADMREEMGRKAKEHVAAWTIQKGWKLWEQAYATL